MSPIGKIFVAVNLALSAAFLGWASNVVGTSQNYKTQLAELEKTTDDEKAALDAELSKLRTELTAVREDKERAVTARDDEKNRADRAERERDDRDAENQQLRGDLSKLQSLLENYNSNLASVSARIERANDQALEMERARNDAVQAQKDAEMALRAAQDATRAAEARAEELVARLDQADERIADLDATLQTAVEAYNIDLSTLTAQPQVDGAVVSVKSEPAPGLVAINKGSEDGVRRGMTFDIYSGSTYKGRVRVELVHGTWCSAVVVKPVQAGATISAGDRASTRL